MQLLQYPQWHKSKTFSTIMQFEKTENFQLKVVLTVGQPSYSSGLGALRVATKVISLQ